VQKGVFFNFLKSVFRTSRMGTTIT